LKTLLVNLKGFISLTEILQSSSLSLISLGKLRLQFKTLLGSLQGLLELADINQGSGLVAKKNVILRIKLNGILIQSNSLIELSFFESLISLYFKFFC
jgi:hypothetical protein